MFRRFLQLSVVALLVLATLSLPLHGQDSIPATPPLTPVTQVQQDGVVLSLYMDRLKQGRVGLVSVAGEVTQPPDASLFNEALTFFQVPGYAEWFALVSVPLNQAQRAYDLNVTVAVADNSLTLTAPVTVVSGNFVQQDVIVISDAGGLFDHDVEDAELANILKLASVVTPVVYWQGRTFNHPMDTELTSPFGAQRVFNGLYETLHTGWDYNASIGKPFVATAPGQVVYAGHTAIRGNYVLIDHGYGIFSGYAHLSVIYVTQGQLVDGGQIVGLVGSTGRSSSAHAHFEMLMNAQWVDSTDFIAMPLPH